MKDNKIYLEHILEAINKIELVIEGILTKEEFLDDENWQGREVIFRQIEVIGEAVKKLNINFKSQHPKIPWKQIAGMRNHLIHEYFAVNQERVWETVQNDIPVLRAQLEQILK